MKSYSEFIQGIHRVVEGFGNDQMVSANSEDEFYRHEGEEMSLVYGINRRPVRNKIEFADALADKYNLKRNQVLEKIRELEQKMRPKEKYDFINVLLDELKKLSGGH
jgi:hypothetical protein